ncbi:hypothetical protein G5I_09898 [Acromyrmex echinatior]|uniref:Uncharacterized protein n=1 Tax=Acromyrmex echinatior TaxID=103372 RepID=F4WVG0_ACREC|nr:hypothetical protein G5I_09898 [Acromyrmex echinatior]
MLIPRVVPSASTSYTLESSGSRDRAPKPSTLLCHEPCIGVLACCPDTTFCFFLASIIIVVANKQQIAEGCWLAGSRTVRQGKARQGKARQGKARQGNGKAMQAVAEYRGDMPCLPAGATTRLTFVRPVLRSGPAGTNETPDLPTRSAVRLVPLRSELELVVEFAIGLVLELDATKRSRKLDVSLDRNAYNSVNSVETNVRYGITLENPGGRRAKTKEPGGSEWSRVDRAICVDRMRSYGRIREERRAGAANDRNGHVAPYVYEMRGLLLTSSLVLARSSQEWNKREPRAPRERKVELLIVLVSAQLASV